MDEATAIRAQEKATIADTIEVIAEKKMAIQETNDDIARADKNMDEATAIRAQEKADFEQELQAYRESLAALNQAIDVLAKFYAKKKKGAFLMQVGEGNTAEG